MMVVLPERADGLAATEARLSADLLERWERAAETVLVDLILPRSSWRTIHSSTSSALQAANVMIRATADHVLPPGLPEPLRSDVVAFLDLDTAILGAGRDEYNAYEAGIRTEYEPVHGAALFRVGRSAFLESVLARKRLFHTDRFPNALDIASRLNMRRALDSLLAEGEPVRAGPAG